MIKASPEQQDTISYTDKGWIASAFSIVLYSVALVGYTSCNLDPGLTVASVVTAALFSVLALIFFFIGAIAKRSLDKN